MFPSIAGTPLPFTCDNAQQKGSRIAVYQRTASGESNADKLISISAMPPYKAKCHEELRWEDYNFTGKGGLGLSSLAGKSTSQGTTSVSSTPNIFGPTIPSLAPGTARWNYTGPAFNSLTSNSFSPFTTSTSTNAFSPFTTSTPSNSFSPFTTSTPSNAFSPFTTSTPSNIFSPFTTSTSTNAFSSFTTSTPSNSLSPFTTSTPSNAFSPFTTSTPSNAFSPFTTSTPSNAFSPFTTSTPSNSLSPFTTLTPSNSLSPFTTSTPSNAFSSFTTSTPSNSLSSFTTSTPSNSLSPFTTSTPSNAFNPFTTSTPSNSFNPFTTSIPSNAFSPFTTSTPLNSFNPFTTSTPSNSFSPFNTITSAPLNSFNPFTPRTNLTFPASTTSSVTLSPFNHNQFTNSSTSLATHSSSPSPTFTAFTNCSWSTAATNAVSVSPMSSGLTSTSNQPTTFLNYNPCVPLTQNSNGPTPWVIGQYTVSQMSSPQITSTEKPSSVASPLGILPACPRVHFDDYHPKQPIQYGISSIPVKDKPAPVRYSLLTTRHLSGRIKLPVRKYDPKSNAPKIPYFSDTKEIPVAVYVPRENPRELVIGPVKWPPSDTREHIHDDKFSSSTYENERDDMTKEEPALFSTILDVPAKLQQPDYYTQPRISELEAKERAEPRYCMHVKDFVVGRHGYGSIKFLGETDVRNVDIETDIQFNNREVIVYMDDSKKPPVGEGLNKPAEITLLNIKLFDKKTGMQHTDGSKVIKYTEMLKKKAVAQGAEFVSYDPVEGEWKFRVQHF